MSIKIALAGNPNCGKTTLFNALTGSNQYVGNWPGVTVEKKEGKLKRQSDVILTDLPGIYSLSPYTLEEVVARNYLIDEHPDAILNIVDGTNIERNLYLTTQLAEIGIPVVVAINMMDIVRKNGDKIDTEGLSKQLGCPVVEISALKLTGIEEAADVAIEAAKNGRSAPVRTFSGKVEHALAHIEEAAVHELPEERQRWYSIKIFERDEKVLKKLALDKEKLDHIEKDIVKVEEALDDDAESIITNERYNAVEEILRTCYKKKNAERLSLSDKIDKIATNRVLALPIFVLVMWLVYYLSIGSIGDWTVGFVNDGVFGDGWYLFGNGRAAYEEAYAEYEPNAMNVSAFIDEAEAQAESGKIDLTISDIDDFLGALEEEPDEEINAIIDNFYAKTGEIVATYEIESEEGEEPEIVNVDLDTFKASLEAEVPDMADFGIYVPGLPSLVADLLTKAGCADWLVSLISDGIIGGVGAVLGFVPQMMILFLLLSILEDCGYMSRIAFILDRIFRKFGLSGKSFIPMLVATGCGVPGIMASRTIEQDRDRKMTIMTTGFIPCGAKMPIVGFIAGALFGGAAWVATAAYFLGVAAVIISGIILKKTRPFIGDPAPFVMELPAYHAPVASNIMRTTFDRGFSFVKRAGSTILVASIIIWILQSLSFEGGFHYITFKNPGASILEVIATPISFIFIPLGFGSWQTAVATILGLVAKEEVVGVFGSLSSMSGISSDVAFELAEAGAEGSANLSRIGAEFFGAGGKGMLAGFSFLIFNLLCAPCFAAMGAIKREMNNWKWTAFAITYMCVFAYAISLITYQLGSWFVGGGNIIGTVFAVIVLAILAFFLFRPNPQKNNK